MEQPSHIPFCSPNGKLYPTPLTIIAATIAKYRNTNLSDWDLATHISDCLAIAMKSNNFAMRWNHSVIGSETIFHLSFEADNDGNDTKD